MMSGMVTCFPILLFVLQLFTTRLTIATSLKVILLNHVFDMVLKSMTHPGQISTQERR